MSSYPEFPPSLFHVVLSYLLPPTPPLPPHLLSKALTQRHHFLNILPEAGPAAYFLWPKPGSAGAGSVIDSLSRISEKPEEVPMGDIEYEAYGDSFHARIGIQNDLQLVFILEIPKDGSEADWKYFDVVWRSKVPKGKPSMLALLESTGSAIDDEDEEMDADEMDPRKAAKEFWGDNWGDEKNVEDAAIASDSDEDLNDEGKYYSRYDNVETVIDDLARTTLSGSSISDSSNLPQIPTEGHNTPSRGNSIGSGPGKETMRAFPRMG